MQANLKRDLDKRKAAVGAFAERLCREVQGMQVEGMKVAAMARELNDKRNAIERYGIWQYVQLSRVVARLHTAEKGGHGTC
ncbi:MAG: hypothetical protein KDE69_15830 [Burkholderiaceae bacterium]|nr:hypothetical protein [Burkholderiaceae bacterium]